MLYQPNANEANNVDLRRGELVVAIDRAATRSGLKPPLALRCAA